MRHHGIYLLAGFLLTGVAFGQTNTNPITRESVVAAEKLIGLGFSGSEMDLMLSGLKGQFDDYSALRRFPLSNSVPPAIQFNPLPIGFKFENQRQKFRASPVPRIKLPSNLDDLAFFSISELAALSRIAPGVTPRDLLRSATLSGAEALGFGDTHGAISPGRRAVLIAVEVPPGVPDVEQYLVSGIAPGKVRWIDSDRPGNA